MEENLSKLLRLLGPRMCPLLLGNVTFAKNGWMCGLLVNSIFLQRNKSLAIVNMLLKVKDDDDFNGWLIDPG